MLARFERAGLVLNPELERAVDSVSAQRVVQADPLARDKRAIGREAGAPARQQRFDLDQRRISCS
jgi:hypothetical protein